MSAARSAACPTEAVDTVAHMGNNHSHTVSLHGAHDRGRGDPPGRASRHAHLQLAPMGEQRLQVLAADLVPCCY